MKEPSSMLAKMFNGEMRPGEMDNDGAYLIDQYTFIQFLTTSGLVKLSLTQASVLKVYLKKQDIME